MRFLSFVAVVVVVCWLGCSCNQSVKERASESEVRGEIVLKDPDPEFSGSKGGPTEEQKKQFLSEPERNTKDAN